MIINFFNKSYKKIMAKKNSKHIKRTNKVNKANKSHHNKSYFKIAFVVMIFLVIIIILNLNNKKQVLSYENTQIILNNQNITENMQDNIIKENEKIYMSIEDIANFIDKTIYQEPETGMIITTSDKKIATIKKDSENITINGSNQNVRNPLIEKDGKIYLAISELESVYNYEIKYIEMSNIITIDSLNNECIKANAKRNIKIKKENKAFSKVIENVEKGNWVIFISEEDGMAKVRTQNGNIGYIKKRLLDNFITQRDNLTEDAISENGGDSYEYDITSEDITTFEKREKVINLILQETIKNDKMNVKIIYNKESDSYFERFKIEALPILQECGITVDI